jgi:hypothetical protein
MASQTTLFLIVGLPGAGKTTRARELENVHRALRFTPDEWMISLFGGPKPPGSVTYWKGCSSMLACALWRSARMSSSTSASGGGTSAAPCVRSAPLLVPWRSRLSAG